VAINKPINRLRVNRKAKRALIEGIVISISFAPILLWLRAVTSMVTCDPDFAGNRIPCATISYRQVARSAAGREFFLMHTPPRPIYAIFLFAFIFILTSSSPAALAQVPKGDAFVGYSRVGNDAFYPNVGSLNGWEAAVHFKIKPLLGIEGDMAHYGLGADSSVPRTTTLMGGPRITVGLVGIHIFGHGLVGGEHSSNGDNVPPISETAFAYALGGGLDVPLLPFFAWRIQGDRISAPSLSPAGSTQARFTTGIVLRF
jgi:hypothetical protein